jgi:hypothetical protein
MSDIFVKGDINDLLSSVETDNVSLPQWLNIVDKRESETSDNELTDMYRKNVNSATSVQNGLLENEYSATSVNMMSGGDFSATSIMSQTSMLNSNFNNMNGLNLSVTSDNNDIFISQMGGNVEKTIASPDDINNLINMLTSEPANNDFDTVTTITNTTVLENQLRELLNQSGGGKKQSKKSSKNQEGGSKKKASKKASKKNSKKKASKKSSKKASKKNSKKSVGGKKTDSDKASKKSKKYTNSDSATSEEEQVKEKKKRAAPAHSAIQTEVIKMIVKKDGINYPSAMKKLKEYITEAIGKPYVKDGDISYIDALKKTKAHLNK